MSRLFGGVMEAFYLCLQEITYKNKTMKKRILGLLVLLFSLQTFAGAANVTVSDEDSIDVTLEKGDADNSDKNPRTLIPITCIYTDGMVQLTLLGEVGEYTLTVTNLTTGERWSINNTPVLQTSTASGTYWVEIEIGDGTLYYGIYSL